MELRFLFAIVSSEIFANRPSFVEIAPKQFKVCTYSGSLELWQAFAIGSQREVAALKRRIEEGHYRSVSIDAV
jgi:hypothetical protein